MTDLRAMSEVTRLSLPTDAGLARVSELAGKQLALAAKMENLAAEVKALTEEYTQLTERDLPDAMDDVGLKAFTMSSGRVVTVESIISANVTEARRAAVIAWLRENGHDGIVLRTVAVKLPKGQYEKGDKFAQALRDLGADPVDELGVNTGTLKAFVKEYLTNGDMINPNGTLNDKGRALPLETFGVFVGRRTHIK